MIQVICIILLEQKTMKELKQVNLSSCKTVTRNSFEDNSKNRGQGLRLERVLCFFSFDFPVVLETVFQKAQEQTSCTAVLILFEIIKTFGHHSV